MPFPFLLAAGIGGQLASMGLNAAAQGQVDAARRAAQQAERERQERWDDKIFATHEQMRNRYDNFSGQQDARAGTVADYYKANSPGLPSSGVTTGVIPQTGNVVLQREAQNQTNKVNAFNDQQGKALGNLRSFGDIMGGASRGAAVDNAMIGGWNAMKQGSANVLPLELQNANNAGNGLKTWADIIGGLGKMGVSAGLSGAGGGASGGGLFGAGDPFSDTIHGPSSPGLFTRMFR